MKHLSDPGYFQTMVGNTASVKVYSSLVTTQRCHGGKNGVCAKQALPIVSSIYFSPSASWDSQGGLQYAPHLKSLIFCGSASDLASTSNSAAPKFPANDPVPLQPLCLKVTVQPLLIGAYYEG